MPLYTTDDDHELGGGIPVTTQERFWDKVLKTDACWLWQAGRTTKGYGVFFLNGGMQGAHRVAWVITFGDIPDRMEVDHECHVISCVNPDHLRLATHAENDEYRKGAQSNSQTGIRGVFWSEQKGKFQGKVNYRGKQHHAGFFDDVSKANEAVKALRAELFKFPEYEEVK